MWRRRANGQAHGAEPPARRWWNAGEVLRDERWGRAPSIEFNRHARRHPPTAASSRVLRVPCDAIVERRPRRHRIPLVPARIHDRDYLFDEPQIGGSTARIV